MSGHADHTGVGRPTRTGSGPQPGDLKEAIATKDSQGGPARAGLGPDPATPGTSALLDHPVTGRKAQTTSEPKETSFVFLESLNSSPSLPRKEGIHLTSFYPNTVAFLLTFSSHFSPFPCFNIRTNPSVVTGKACVSSLPPGLWGQEGVRLTVWLVAAMLLLSSFCSVPASESLLPLCVLRSLPVPKSPTAFL